MFRALILVGASRLRMISEARSETMTEPPVGPSIGGDIKVASPTLIVEVSSGPAASKICAGVCWARLRLRPIRALPVPWVTESWGSSARFWATAASTAKTLKTTAMIRMPRGVFIATITTTLSAAAVLAAFLVSTVTVSVDIGENIILDSPSVIELTLFPGETAEVEIVLRNIGPEDQAVEIDTELIEGNHIEVTDPGLVAVPADGEPHTYIVTIEAEGDVEPTEHTLTIEIKRE